MIATEKKPSSILIDESMLEKVAVVCPNIGLVYSGMGPDFRVLVTKVSLPPTLSPTSTSALGRERERG